MKLSQETLDELKNIRKNLISWYPFKENSKILEIDAFGAAIAKEFGGKYTSVQKIEEINKQEKYDYILISGVVERSKALFHMNVEELIKTIKQFLNEDGILLISTDNKLGINNLCTEATSNEAHYLGKSRIEKLLDAQGFINRKIYYPLPNYILPNVIFTDKHLPDLETINRCLTFYDNNTAVALDEVQRYRKVIEEDKELFRYYANSFFIECSLKPIEENNIEFVSFSNIRKPEFRIQTVIQKDKVFKYNAEEESKQHIQNIKNNIDIMKNSNIKTLDSYDETRIISSYQESVETVDKVILQKCRNENIDEAIAIIENFNNKLIESLEKTDSENNVFDKYEIKCEKEIINNLHFVKHGLWDLILKNCFYINNEFYFYDQEWIQENIPVEFILYRAILYLDGIDKYISREKIYEKFNLNEKQIQLFKELDDALQKEIRDEKAWNLHVNLDGPSNLTEKVKRLEQEKEKILNDCQELLLQKDGRINVLEEGMQEATDTIKKQEATITGIMNSASWKITKPLRKAKQIIKK